MEEKSCDKCSSNTAAAVPFYVYESAMERADRKERRWWILAIILVFLLVGTNIAWIVYESQFETVGYSQEVNQEGKQGDNNFVGGDYYGETNN